MVLLFKGIATPSQFPATIASGATPTPNHACFQGRVDECAETSWRSKGGRGCLHHAHYAFPKKKNSLRALLAHNKRTYTSGKRVEMLHHPCILRNPQTKGDKIRIGCLHPAFLGAQKWAEMLHHPCILGGPQQRGQNQSPKKTNKKT